MIYGCELYECENIEIKDKDNKYFHLICLIRNEQGRKDLQKYIEDTTECVNVGIKNFILVGRC